jgi:alkylated DNA repair dioxygenase AlkB
LSVSGQKVAAAAEFRIGPDSGLPDGEVCLIPGFLPKAAADRYLAQVRRRVDWERHVIRIRGRSVASPRLSAWHGDPGASYAYSGLSLEPRPWLPVLRELKSQIEQVCDASFNSVLLNLYRDGSDHMGWHSDDEPELGDRPLIASVSLGASRRFRLRHKRRRDLEPVVVTLDHGSLLIMRGETQRFWKHQISKSKRLLEERVNLTFRRILPRSIEAPQPTA